MRLSPAIVLVEPAAFAVGLAVMRLPIAALAKREKAIFAVLAALSAAGAVAAGGSATGLAPLDAVLVAGLGAVGVYAGSRSSSKLIVLGAVIAAAAGTGSAALPLALAAVGLGLATVLIEPEAVVDAAAGGLVTQAALRLTHPGGDGGLTALVAAVALVPMLVSAFRTLRRSHRKKIYRAALGALGFSIAGGVLGLFAAAASLGPLQHGLDVASRAVTATPSGLEETATALREAGADFAQARGSLDAWWAWPARAVPVVGPHLRVLRAAAHAGRGLATAGRRVLGAPALVDIHVSNGRLPLDQVAEVERPVADLAARATDARRHLSDARSPFLVPPLSHELNTQLKRLTEIEQTVQLASRVLPMVPELFGADGPRRYFLAVQTPVEARAGGGFLGSFGEITADAGQLELTRLGRQDDLAPGPQSPARHLQGSEEYLARYGRFQPEYEWANVNLSPDFPSDARVIADLYPQSGGAPVDGVIAVDPYALVAILQVGGPVQVPSWPTAITADNVVQTLLYDQYQSDKSRSAREDFLGEVAGAAWRRLTGGNLPPLPQLLTALGPAVRDKHLMLWSNRAPEQRLFEDMKAAGKIAPVDGDFVGLVTQNATGNKIDYFLRRELDYQVQLDPGNGRLRASAKISLHNEAPADGVGVQLIGNDLVPRLPSGTNKLYLSFYTPWNIVSGKVNGTPVDFERATELGRKVYSTAVEIPPRSTVTLELDLSGRLTGGDSYRLDVYRQPMVAPDDVTTTLTLEPGWLALAGSDVHQSKLRLEHDATIEVSLGRR